MTGAEPDEHGRPEAARGGIFKGSTVVSKLTTAEYDGSKPQKWNAPANIEDPTTP